MTFPNGQANKHQDSEDMMNDAPLKMRRLATMACALILPWHSSAAFGQIAAIPGDGFRGVWYENGVGAGGYPNKFGGALSTFPQQNAPMAVYSATANKTFFTFAYDMDPGENVRVGHAISYYDHSLNEVARPQVWVDKNTENPNGAPSLAIDDSGYLYLFSSGNGETGRAYINKSANPWDISSYTELLSPTDGNDMDVFGNPPEAPGMEGSPHFNYGSPWYVPNTSESEKFLLIHGRTTEGTFRDVFTTSSVDGDNWTTRKTFTQIEDGTYQTSWIKPGGSAVGAIFNVLPTGEGPDGRTDLYYAQTSDMANTWQTVDGSTVVDNSFGNNPLTSRPAGNALVYQAAVDERVFLKDLNYDAAGNPVMLFLSSPTATPGDLGPRTVKTAHWSGSAWVVRDVTTTDNNYDHGSLYVESNGTWRIMAPFVDGPQQYATGGEMGMWTSTDQGQTWSSQQLTSNSFGNHSYARRPVDAQDAFYAFWGEGDGWEKSSTNLLFADKTGAVYGLPANMTSATATPELYTPAPLEHYWSTWVQLADESIDGTIESVSMLNSEFPDGRNYRPADLIPARLTGYGGDEISGNKQAHLILTAGLDPSTLDAADRKTLLGDGKADTGFINLTSWSVDFADPILNRPGPDIVLLDWGSSDPVEVIIDGHVYAFGKASVDVASDNMGTSRPRWISNETSVDTLGELETATFPDTQAGASTSPVSAYLIDLSDFGFALGDYLLAGEDVAFANADTIDPLEIFGLPIPGDFTHDGIVDGQDLLLWQRTGGTAVDLADWQAYFGELAPSASPAQHSVPEPVGALLALAASLSVAAIRVRVMQKAASWEAST
ncbi:MAG: hypothetical protein KDA61_03345 [Planctomycetales bacterium]|nr:hypothetical protein [Planctomycetales bacterium]